MNKSDLRNYYIDQIKKQIPSVLAKKIENNRVLIICPYCNKTHIHGFSNGDKVIHRGSHCTDTDLEKANLIREDVALGYEIILSEGE